MVGKKTVFDIDDALSGVKLNPEAEERVIQMIKNSSAVIVGRHELRDFARNFNDQVYLILFPYLVYSNLDLLSWIDARFSGL